jgi:hypothetical protein
MPMAEFVLVLFVWVNGEWHKTMPFSYHATYEECREEREIIFGMIRGNDKFRGLLAQLQQQDAKLVCEPAAGR